MIAVSEAVHLAAHRFSLVHNAGGRVRRSQTQGKIGYSVAGGIMKPGVVSEFVTSDGEVLARKVEASTGVACWLRADLAEAAAQALEREAADYERTKAEMVAFMDRRDGARAREQGMTVADYRVKRNHTLAAIDARRGVNSRGLG